MITIKQSIEMYNSWEEILLDPLFVKLLTLLLIISPSGSRDKKDMAENYLKLRLIFLLIF